MAIFRIYKKFNDLCCSIDLFYINLVMVAHFNYFFWMKFIFSCVMLTPSDNAKQQFFNFIIFSNLAYHFGKIVFCMIKTLTIFHSPKYFYMIWKQNWKLLFLILCNRYYPFPTVKIRLSHLFITIFSGFSHFFSYSMFLIYFIIFP